VAYRLGERENADYATIPPTCCDISATELDRPAFEPYGGWGFQGESGLGEESVDEAGRYWMR
jgi:hypothetical protein